MRRMPHFPTIAVISDGRCSMPVLPSHGAFSAAPVPRCARTVLPAEVRIPWRSSMGHHLPTSRKQGAEGGEERGGKASFGLNSMGPGLCNPARPMAWKPCTLHSACLHALPQLLIITPTSPTADSTRTSSTAKFALACLDSKLRIRLSLPADLHLPVTISVAYLFGTLPY